MRGVIRVIVYGSVGSGFILLALWVLSFGNYQYVQRQQRARLIAPAKTQASLYSIAWLRGEIQVHHPRAEQTLSADVADWRSADNQPAPQWFIGHWRFSDGWHGFSRKLGDSRWNAMGFAWADVDSSDPFMTNRRWEIYMPGWFPVLLCTFPVAVFALGILRKRRRRLAGCCVNCGYDLRASPTRCPECGAPATHRPDATPANP